MAETLRQRIEQLRDDLVGPSFDVRVDASYVTGRLTAILAHARAKPATISCVITRLREELEQARVQLAGCLVAAEGGTSEPVTAEHGDYGWSLAYQRTLDLSRADDRLREGLAALVQEMRKWSGAATSISVDRWADRLAALREGREVTATTCTDCPRCGDHVRTSDLRQWKVCEQTHWEPAEYDDGCINCCPKEQH